jgi:hypothetical protein
MATVISGFSLANVVRSSLAEGSTYFALSGYILDSHGKGIEGAAIIFNVPDIVHSVLSDKTGHYVIYAPAGTYHVNVWPPFDSNFIYHDQPSLTVSSDMTKNITLNSGYKVSGYITSTTGQPVKDGIVLLDNYLSGWFSKDTGYYFVCAPTGTYKLWASPRNGYNHFVVWSESNFVLDRDIVKNITGALTNTPTPTPTPEPTPTTPDQGWISIFVCGKSCAVGSVLDVTGRVTDYDANPIPNQKVVLYIANLDNFPLTYSQIGSATTAKTGDYAIQWTIERAGSFLLKVEWIIDGNFPTALNTTSVGFDPNNKNLQAAPASIVSAKNLVAETEQTNSDAGNKPLIIAAAIVILAVAVVSVVAVRVGKNRKAPRTDKL